VLAILDVEVLEVVVKVLLTPDWLDQLDMLNELY
jgi:hypothetical protein